VACCLKRLINQTRRQALEDQCVLAGGQLQRGSPRDDGAIEIDRGCGNPRLDWGGAQYGGRPPPGDNSPEAWFSMDGRLDLGAERSQRPFSRGLGGRSDSGEVRREILQQ